MSMIFHVSVYLWMVFKQCVLLSAPGCVNMCLFTLYDWSVFVRFCLRVCLTRVSLTHASGPDSSRRHPHRELACRSTQSGHTRTVIEERFPLPTLPLSFLFLVSCDSSWFHFAAPLHPPPNSPPLPPPPSMGLSLFSLACLIPSLPLFLFPSWLCKWPHFNEAQSWRGDQTAWLEPPSLHLSKPPCTTESGFHSQC